LNLYRRKYLTSLILDGARELAKIDQDVMLANSIQLHTSENIQDEIEGNLGVWGQTCRHIAIIRGELDFHLFFFFLASL